MNNFISYNLAKLQKQVMTRPYALRVDTNNTCNLNCIYCRINDYVEHAEYMTLQQFTKLAKLFFPVSRYVSLSFGTEPLMSKKFPEFVEMLGDYSVPDTHFITNGLLLTEEVIERSINSNINTITISNDAAEAETYMRIRGKMVRGVNASRGGLDVILAKLELIRKLKGKYKSQNPNVRIQYTFFDYNKGEVIPFIERYHMYFQEFYLTHLSTMYLDSYDDPILKRISEEEYADLKSKVVKIAAKYNLLTKITFNDLERRYLSNKWCSFPLTNRFIRHNGDMLMCDKQVYGNIFSEDLSEINERIHDAFKFNNPNCIKKCTQPIAKAREI